MPDVKAVAQRVFASHAGLRWYKWYDRAPMRCRLSSNGSPRMRCLCGGNWEHEAKMAGEASTKRGAASSSFTWQPHKPAIRLSSHSPSSSSSTSCLLRTYLTLHSTLSLQLGRLTMLLLLPSSRLMMHAWLMIPFCPVTFPSHDLYAERLGASCQSSGYESLG